MEIHELNTFSGTLGSGDFFATDNGTDTSKVSAESLLAPLNARIDNIIAGPAPSAEEVTDARLGTAVLGGTQYSSLGAAVRGQAEELFEDIGKSKENTLAILDNSAYDICPFSVVTNEYVSNSNGSFIAYNGWDRSGYIAVDSSKDLYAYSEHWMNFCAQYDENHGFIKSLSIAVGLNDIALDARTAYIAISTLSGDLANITIWQDSALKIRMVSDNVFELDNLANVPWRVCSLGSSGEQIEATVRLTSDYIEIPYKGAALDIYLDGSWGIIVSEYDENKQFIYMQSSYIDASYIKMLYPNTKYIRVIAVKAGQSSNPVFPKQIWTSNIHIKVIGLPDTLKVMSYNLGHYAYGTGMGLPSNIYDEKLTNYRRFFGKELPDVCGFQEYDSRMDEENTVYSRDVLWDYFYKNSYYSGTQEAIYSNLDLSFGAYKELSTGRPYVEMYGNGIYLISVHLSVGANNASARLAEAREIVNIASQYERFIIFGDFNPEPGEEGTLFKVFTDAGMNIANCGFFGKFYTWTSNRADFDDYDHPTGTLWYIDNVITSDNIKITGVRPVPEAFSLLASDHIPIVAELEL